MLIQILIFIAALSVLLLAARFFTQSAETIGSWLRMSPFIIGVFIVGIGTSLPELVSSILSVRQGLSEIVPGNVMGANISNILLITGVVAYLNKIELRLTRSYIFIDLHYLIGGLLIFTVISYDGQINWAEGLFGIFAFIIYSFYLLKEGDKGSDLPAQEEKNSSFPVKAFLILLLAGVGIYFGADYTISSLSAIAEALGIPPAIIALTLLSLGTTLPELAVNIAAIREGKAEMAVGNVLGSCIFNAMVVPGAASFFGSIHVPQALIGFSLPFMLGAGLFFYLLTQDKKISRWEGILFIILYGLFLIKVANLA
ncbi:MAG: calcium/sodium antiporter [Chitinophagales bacterium]|nr:calcium/sodium antiporter [Chitinophagales bacterium]